MHIGLVCALAGFFPTAWTWPNRLQSAQDVLPRAASSGLLDVFQVYPPVLTVAPNGTFEVSDGSSTTNVEVVSSKTASCQQVLVVYSFGFSYGQPFVGQYNPPKCTFNRVTWNLTVTSAGRQFDRLGSVFLGDIEVFRTSTAEPTANGIIWSYLKDMTSYLTLFKAPQKLIFDLGNLIDNTYTGRFNVTLTASYFVAPESVVPADIILPVSSRKSGSGQPSMFSLPSDLASNELTLPRNVKKAVFTVAATGQSAEEFWWSNVLQSTIDTFPAAGELYGYSPFREVQLFIDGTLAGVAWPFPIIFTGGVVPGLWRPIVGIDAFDLKEDEIDITPFLPLLCDGKPHNFTIKVSGLNDDGRGDATLSETTGSYWLVTGKVFIWSDASGHITTGTKPLSLSLPPVFKTSSLVSKNSDGSNGTLLYSVLANRQLSYQSTLQLSTGPQLATWSQTLSYSNNGNFSQGGNYEINRQQTSGFDRSSSGYLKKYSYPLYAVSNYTVDKDGFSIVATVNRGKDLQTLGQPVFPTGLESFSGASNTRSAFSQFQGTSLTTEQDGSASYYANQTAGRSSSFGQTTQDMVLSGIRIGLSQSGTAFPSIAGGDEVFRRHVSAINGTVIEDDSTLIGHGAIGHYHGSVSSNEANSFAAAQVPGHGRKWLGRLTVNP